MLAVVLPLVAIVVALVSWLLPRRRREERRQEQFAATRAQLREQRAHLTRAALERSPHRLPDGLPLLGHAHWVPAKPLPLHTVNLRWAEPSPSVDDAREQASKVVALRRGSASMSYSAATASFDPPSSFFNGPSYRLLAVEAAHQQVTLDMGTCHYFDAFDTTEIIGFETALGGGTSYRSWLGSPFDFARRAAIPGVSTLTLTRDGAADGLQFFMHERDSRNVGTAQNAFHVIPAGEFQPIDVSPIALRRDLDLWSTICREYAEEFLGHPESSGRSGWEIDWTSEEPYASLSRARSDGSLTVWFLGVGLDPLTWKPEILTACVFEHDLFERVFAGMKKSNDEGLVLSRQRFDDANVRAYLDEGRTLPAGAACLSLAWQHREQLATQRPSMP